MDFKEKRIEYISKWPNVEKFNVEIQYEKLLERNIDGDECFKGFTFEYSNDIAYNKALSFIVDSLDMMPRNPNFAFQFIFKGIDIYSNSLFGGNFTNRLQNISTGFLFDLLNKNEKFKSVFNNLYGCMPNTTCKYLYSRLYKDYNQQEGFNGQSSNLTRQLLSRLKIDSDQNMEILLENIFLKYRYDCKSIREGSRLIYKIFNSAEINLNSYENFQILELYKLRLLICGILYTMRNDNIHGSSISSFKSSKSTLKTYAHSYYCFLSSYIVLTLLLVNDHDKFEEELINNFNYNINIFKNILLK